MIVDNPQRPQELEAVATKENLQKLGMLSVSGGINFDLNVVPKKIAEGTIDGHLCDHNCRLHYVCQSSFTLNKGVKPIYAPINELREAFLVTADGVREANRFFQETGVYADYYQSFGIPLPVQEAMKDTLDAEIVERNFFGGNPEMYPQLPDLIEAVREDDPKSTVTLTTTGRIFFRFPERLPEYTARGINILALSCDDITPNALRTTQNMDNKDLRAIWNTIPKDNGHAQKAIEAIATAKIIQGMPESQQPQLLFNLAVHKGNLAYLEEFIEELHNQFPNAIINPFPAQSSFDHEPSVFGNEDLEALHKMTAWAIKVTKDGNFPIAKRLHYWLLLQSAIEYHIDSDRQQAAKAMSGYGIWKCYEELLACRYPQVGKGTTPWQPGQQSPGLHLSCYWDKSVTDNSERLIDVNSIHVANYIQGGIKTIADKLPKSEQCPGCIMPRLVFDQISLEAGMNTLYKDLYLTKRKEHVGF